MAITTSILEDAAQRLHDYAFKYHWKGEALEGPDSGFRWEFRIGRFVKSYLNFLPWADNFAFLQTQGYWTSANWFMSEVVGGDTYREIALTCSQYMLGMQREEGFWMYPPIGKRKGLIATVEGNYAAIALMDSYRHTGQKKFLEAARLWYRFLTEEIGFQKPSGGDFLAINYWATPSPGAVPNNSASTLHMIGKLIASAQDDVYREHCAPMVAWLRHVQKESGELPYTVANEMGGARPHFLCFQYNAFQFLNLAQYYQYSEDTAILPVLDKLAQFLSTGISAAGAARYNCQRVIPQVPYYTAAVAAALSHATTLGLGDYQPTADRAFTWLLAQQNEAGGMRFFSKGNYGFLTDARSYPRNLAMILYHLLLTLQIRDKQVNA